MKKGYVKTGRELGQLVADNFQTITFRTRLPGATSVFWSHRIYGAVWNIADYCTTVKTLPRLTLSTTCEVGRNIVWPMSVTVQSWNGLVVQKRPVTISRRCVELPVLWLLSGFAKSRKTTVSFVMSVCLCVSLPAWNTSVPTGRILIKFYL
jgi:hypothetical protein